MSINRTIAAAVVVSLVASVLPAAAWAAEDQSKATAAKAPAVDLRGSTERALASVAGDRVQVTAPPTEQKTGRRNAAKGGGGKGGGMGAAMAIVGIAASIGTTYFVIQQMHKTEAQLTPTPQVVR
jgi:hypothetical protein